MKEKTTSDGPASAVAPSPPPSGRYYFSVESSLSVPETKRLAKGPLGTRVNMVYSSSDSRVFTKEAEYSGSWRRRLPSAHEGPFEWEGLEGRILSGGDFALIRTDGVLALDGRLTIQAKDGTLVDAVYKGLVDLDLSRSVAARARDAVGGASPREATGAELLKEYRGRERRIYEDFINGALSLGGPEGRCLQLHLSIHFETGSGPWSDAPDEDLSWVGEQYRVNQDHFLKYRKLLRSQFFASGTAMFRKPSPGTLPVAERIEFDVYELVGAH